MRDIRDPPENLLVNRLSSREIAYTAMFAALVAASTLMLQVGISASHGYFNVGEIMVYTSALLLGPFLGAAAGGIGSSITDAISGYAPYAPGTLVIKGTEAFLVAYIALHKPRNLTDRAFRAITILSTVLIGGFLFALGSLFYAGSQLSSVALAVFPGIPSQPGVNYFAVTITYGVILWLAIGVATTALLLFFTLRLGPERGWAAVAILVGGTEMVIGYLLYEIFVYPGGLGVIIEVPGNIGQMVIGLIVGLPLARRVKSAVPWLLRSAL